MKIFFLVLGILLLAVVGFVAFGIWALYREFYATKDSANDLEVYTSDGQFREDAFGSSP